MTISEYHFFGYGTAPGQKEESMSTIYESTHGSVKEINGVPYAVYRGPPTEFMCELATEIEQLRAEVEKLKTLAEVGAAIERAKKELPSGWVAEVLWNRTGHDVKVVNGSRGKSHWGQGETLAEQINDAVEHAKESV